MKTKRTGRRRVYVDVLRTPLGWIRAAADDDSLFRVLLPCADGTGRFQQEISQTFGLVEIRKGGRILSRFFEELAGYFEGNRSAFRTPVRLNGTPFQQRVWRAVSQIPFGETRSYAWVAEQIGSPGAARAVGQANGSNPVPLVVPCHRVVSADGGPGGFSAGVRLKMWLLRWEHLE